MILLSVLLVPAGSGCSSTPKGDPGGISPPADAGNGIDAGSHDQTDGHTSDANADASANTDAAACACPAGDAGSASDPLTLPLDCYCDLALTCAADGGAPTLCVDNDAVESVYDGCHLREVAYTNGGGLEQVRLYFDTTSGAWVGAYHITDGADQCGHNVTMTGVSSIDPSCTRTSQRSLCGAGDAGGD